MEFDESNNIEETEGDAVEIYSKKAVFWFFMLLGPLFGGVLLMLNLKAAGYKRAINIIFFFILLFDIGSELLLVTYVNYYKIDLIAYQRKLFANTKGDLSVFDEKITILMVSIIVLRVIGGLILTRYFFKKYFPDDDYYPKSIANVLFISIFAFIILSLFGLSGL